MLTFDMNKRKRLSKRIVTAGFWFALIVIISTAYFSYQNMQALFRSGEWVSHSHNVIESLEILSAKIKDAESNSRGFLLFRDDEYYNEFLAQKDDINRLLIKIKQLTADNEFQQNNLAVLSSLVEKRIAFLEDAAELFRMSELEDVKTMAADKKNKELRFEIDREITSIKNYEREYLRVRKAALNENDYSFTWKFFASILFSVLAILYVYSVLKKEIKERIKAEGAITQSRNWFATTLSGIGDGVIATDKNGNVVFMNTVASTITGWDEAEAEGKPIEEVFNIINESTRAEVESPVRKAISEKTITGLANHTILISKNGREIHIDDSGAPILASNDDVMGAVLVFRDITRRRELEREKEKLQEELANHNKFLDQLLSSIPESIFLYTSSGNIIYANQTAIDLVGKKKEQFLGKSKWLLHPDRKDYAQYDQNIDKVFASPEKMRGTIKTRQNDKNVALEYQVGPITDEEGKTRYVIASLRDITRRVEYEKKIKRLNKELEQRISEIDSVNKELEAFIYTVSHDLRAPVRHIGGFVEILQRNIGASLSENNLKYFNFVKDSTAEMGKMIDDLLSFARLGRSSLKMADFDMNGLIKESMKFFGAEIENRNIVWKTASLPVVRADYSLAKIALNNLIGNAIKYTSTRNKAVIEIGYDDNSSDDFYTFYIKDNGVGFDMKYKEKLFGVFQRLHSGEEFEGSGIGLATVKKIIDRHGGSIWAESQVDEGSAFYFKLAKADKA